MTSTLLEKHVRRVFNDNLKIIFDSKLWVLIRVAKYPQHMFLWRNMENYPSEVILMSTHNICLYGELSKIILNPYKPSVPFLAHRQTVQTQIRRRKMQRLIRVLTVC